MFNVNIANQLIVSGRFTKTDLSKLLGISRPTLDYRLKKGNWRYKEVIKLQKLVK